MMAVAIQSVMRRFAAYGALFRITFFETFAYLSDMFGGGLIMVFRLWIFTQLYTATYAAMNTTVINGATLPMVLWILFITQTVSRSPGPSIAWWINKEIKEGTMVTSLLRPFSYLRSTYVQMWGRVFPHVLVFTVMGIVPMALFAGFVPVTVGGLFFGIISLAIGLTINFLSEAVIGLSSLWIEDNSGIRWVYGKLVMVFGGMILPIALFPDSVRAIANWMPFAQVYYRGSELLLNFSVARCVETLLVQLGWLVIMGLLVRYIFHKGIQHVSLNGG